MDLVQGENRRRRVVNRRRKRLQGDVHHDAERKGRVLLQRAFLADGNRLVQGRRRERRAALKNAEQGVADGHVIADLRKHFNNTIRPPGQRQEALLIESEDHTVLGAGDRRGRRPQGNRCGRRRVRLPQPGELRINGFNDFAPRRATARSAPLGRSALPRWSIR